MSNLIDLNVEFHKQIIDEWNSTHVKFDILNQDLGECYTANEKDNMDTSSLYSSRAFIYAKSEEMQMVVRFVEAECVDLMTRLKTFAWFWSRV